MRKINYIVIHKSETPNGQPCTVQEVDGWHRERGFRRDELSRLRFNPDLTSIGYHYMIYPDGSRHTGRDESEPAAAVRGHNHDSINICLAGNGIYTPEQWDDLQSLVVELKSRYSSAAVRGHCQFPSAIAQGKTCPDFDVPAWFDAGMTPPDGHIYQEDATP
jgi:hypothetical protein